MRTGWSCMNTVSHRRATCHPACPGTARPSTRGLLTLLLVTSACGNRIEGKQKKLKTWFTYFCLLSEGNKEVGESRGLMNGKQNRGRTKECSRVGGERSHWEGG